jgi:hypothetical protein
MCLHIKLEQSQNEKDLNHWFGSRKRFAYVYKVLRKWPDEDIYRSIWYPYFIWDFKIQKIYRVNRSSKLTKEELSYGEIYEGFHVYTTLEEAKSQRYTYSKETIVKFRVLKEDIVAIQNNIQNNKYLYEKKNFKEAVCKRLEFVKILED